MVTNCKTVSNKVSETSPDFQNGYRYAINDMVYNLIHNSRTEAVDGKIQLIVTEERINIIANEEKVKT
jgi:hypothetical protein